MFVTPTLLMGALGAMLAEPASLIYEAELCLYVRACALTPSKLLDLQTLNLA